MPWLKVWVKGENANLLINKTTPASAHCFPSSFPSPPERTLSPPGLLPGSGIIYVSPDSGLNPHLAFGLTSSSAQSKALHGHWKALGLLPSP